MSNHSKEWVYLHLKSDAEVKSNMLIHKIFILFNFIRTDYFVCRGF